MVALFTFLSGPAKVCAAEPTLAILDAGPQSSEDAPFVASDYRFYPGDYLYFQFHVAGFAIEADEKTEVRKISLAYEITPQDANGVPLTAPVSGDIQDELNPEDKNWTPKRRASFLLPSFVAAGHFRLHLIVKDLIGKPRTLDDGRPGGFYVPRFRNLKDKQKDFVRGYGFEGSAGTGMFPGASRAPGFGAAYKKSVREYEGATIGMGGFGEVLSRYENAVSLDPVVKDKWGIPVLRFDFKFGDNEKKMAADMANTAREIFEEAGIEVVDHDRHILTEGWSIHELGTARMGDDPKKSVLTQHQQSHDVKNLFVVDGSSHVSASCQNPTWTIMALAWRSCDYLADELRKGNL